MNKPKVSKTIMKPKTLTASFTKRYVIAISLIALLSSITFYILNLALSSSDSTALVVNMSGKQRMLSQRIASLSQQYYLHTYHEHDMVEGSKIHSKLTEAILEMGNANEALASGQLNEDTNVELSPAISALYFGKKQLHNRVNTYLFLSTRLMQSTTETEMDKNLHQLISLSHTLLPDLHAAVLQYQKEGEHNINTIHNLELTAWLITLFTLMMEVIFIFQPMANTIRKLFEKVEWNQQNLEQQIELRTLNLEQANMKLAHIASHDPLTGLKNRLNLEMDLEALISHYNENHISYAVAMLDIDWFKRINDTYGHDAGDFILHEVAQILMSNVRENDNVYRAGGEEFVILYNRITQEQALHKTDKIRLLIEEHPFELNHVTIHITISGGLYHPDLNHLQNVHAILKFADTALYHAKHSGRNQIQ